MGQLGLDISVSGIAWIFRELTTTLPVMLLTFDNDNDNLYS